MGYKDFYGSYPACLDISPDKLERLYNEKVYYLLIEDCELSQIKETYQRTVVERDGIGMDGVLFMAQFQPQYKASMK